ncbi:Spy/CpxP family protein refolding chaperone [Desulfatiglans anilini]|uniref:Spy/CpxP family protein refolding chaperone n=1 Tax=Desulfatiglans anilini TaxID=90728 RepID=UPI00041CF7D0|nr:hypothetical protein [Desulfatiglans anilini]
MLSLHTSKIILLTAATLAFGFWGIGLTTAAEDQTTKGEQNATVAPQTGRHMQQTSAESDAAHRHGMGMQDGYPDEGCPKAKAMKNRDGRGGEMMARTKSGEGEGQGAGRMAGKGGMAARRMMGTGMMRGMMSHMMGGPGGMDEMMTLSGCRRMAGPCLMDAGARMIADLEELDLTAEQWSRVRILAQEKLDRMADLWARHMKLRIELAGIQWGGNLDAEQVKDAFVKEAEARAEMYLAGIEYIRGLKEILTPEQLERMEDQGSEVSGNHLKKP